MADMMKARLKQWLYYFNQVTTSAQVIGAELLQHSSEVIFFETACKTQVLGQQLR